MNVFCLTPIESMFDCCVNNRTFYCSPAKKAKIANSLRMFPQTNITEVHQSEVHEKSGTSQPPPQTDGNLSHAAISHSEGTVLCMQE